MKPKPTATPSSHHLLPSIKDAPQRNTATVPIKISLIWIVFLIKQRAVAGMPPPVCRDVCCADYAASKMSPYACIIFALAVPPPIMLSNFFSASYSPFET